MNEISRAEIEAELPRFSTAHDLIRVLRPGMLVARAPETKAQSPVSFPQASHGIKVYVDGFLYGGVETLGSIPANAVLDVRWLSALDATTRYGTGNAAGAIMVTTRARRR